MYNHRQDIPLREVPTFENVKSDNTLNDSVLDYQNGAVPSKFYSYDYSMVVPLDQVPYKPHDE
ncbi:hypothetical protein [Pseudalkalibacillus decolorationis]|uniref:hypothetical protein n=1 Tax=Pseudalkalibacillus decolorationis TaxID=163879 RepID=UPI002148C493|nr:hypothetical protein [Pseudalkalibacillus decolorationis]